MKRHCERHGTDFEPTAPGYFKLPSGSIFGSTGCPGCEREYQRIVFRSQAEIAQIPPRFVSSTFEDFKVSNAGQRCALKAARDYVAAFDDHRACGRCLTFTGGLGTGKTMLASLIGTALLRSNRTMRYTTAGEIIRDIHSTWRRDSAEDEHSVLRRLQKVDLLVMDEIGAKDETENDMTRLSEVVDLRYQEVRPTLVISNYPMNELGRYLGERAVDRLKDNGGQAVIFDWPRAFADATDRFRGI